jgi:4-hydroxy-3-methylbut-2-en-1-yl diphosphate synthase IspG/GcpE
VALHESVEQAVTDERGEDGRIKSAAGIGALLIDGIKKNDIEKSEKKKLFMT